MKNLVINAVALFLCAPILSRAQALKGFVKGGDVFGTRAFIENKGQFDWASTGGEKIYHALVGDNEQIFFTGKGLIYKQTIRPVLTEEQREAEERGEKINDNIKRRTITMSWLNTNSNIEIQCDEKQAHYFTYGGAELQSATYKKIVHKNVYPFIDIVYTIPVNKPTGIKYDLVLRPGANMADVKIKYSGDVESIKKDKEGNIVVKGGLFDLIEHSPESFFDNGVKLKSSFALNNKIISFQFNEIAGKPDQTIIVDPWVTSVTTLSATNAAYDVDYDYSGNVYVYGGQAPCKIAKYNSAGVLQWTFSGQLISPSWTNANYAGNFVVNKLNGKIYVGQGFSAPGTTIIRLDASGNYDNLITPAYTSWKEVWDMGFDCASGKVYGFGGTTSSNQTAGIVDQITGGLTPVAFYSVNAGPNVGAGYDVVSHAIDDTGDIYWIYGSTQQGVNNKIARINSAFTSSVWIQPSTFTVFQESANKSAYVGANIPSNGFNCLAVNANFLFYYDGLNLAAYNKSTGVLMGAATLPLNTVKRQGGIAADNCNNIYVGGLDELSVFKFNGISFFTLTPIPLATGSLSSYVYDIRLNKASKNLYVSGFGFVGVYPAIHSMSCNIPGSCQSMGVIQSMCAGAPTQATVTAAPNLLNPSYTLIPGNLTNTTGIFVVTPTAGILFTVTATGIGPANTSATYIAVSSTVTVPAPTVSVAASATLVCAGEPVMLTGSGALQYDWGAGFMTNTTMINPQNTLNFVMTGIDSVGCIGKDSVTIYVDPCVGVKENTLQSPSISVFPVPATHLVEVRLINFPENAAAILSIFSVEGKLLKYEEAGNLRVTSIDISLLPKGLYFLEVICEDKKVTKELAVER